MTISIDPNLLLSFYQLKAGIVGGVSINGSTTSLNSSSLTGATTPTNPTAPWTTTPTPTASQTSALVNSVLNGGAFINTNATKIDVANASPNYKNLFGLYQGLTALQDLATQAATPGVGGAQLSQLQQAFSSGMTQVSQFLSTTQFQGFQLSAGTDKTVQQSSVAVAKETDVYNTGVIYAGDQNTAVPAFQGNVSFSATVTKESGAQQTINFNLNDMGTTPRTIGNVVNYLNKQLTAAGVGARFASVMTPATPQTIIGSDGTPVTLPPGPNQYSLQVVGDSAESVAFTAPTTAPAVYVTQTSGVTTAAAAAAANVDAQTGTTADAVQQLIKIDPSATASTTNQRTFTDALGAQVTNVTATATAPDGSVYVLGDINGPTAAGETDAGHKIVGTQDVALMKYDSAGNLLSTTTLGDASTASGLALSVSADGSKVAVAGTVTGTLTGTDTPDDPTVTSSFVSVYDSQGNALWTARQNADDGDQANSVAVANDGSAYVGGATSSTLTGAATTATTTGYLTGYDASGDQTFTTQFGTTGQNRVTGVAIDGSSVVTAGVENGDAVVRSYAVPSSGKATLTNTSDLGALQGGSVAGISVNADGSVVVAGTTHNGSLSAGTVTNAYASGSEAFVAKFSSASLAPSSANTLTYYKAGGDTSVSGVTTSNGQVYITGQVAVTPTSSLQSSAYNGYVTQIDTSTGAATWTNQFTGLDQESAPSGVAVSQNGSSVLSAFGLPTGTINNTPASLLTTTTALRAGDQFGITVNGVNQKITIESDDTLQSLITKIGRASGFNATATLVTVGGAQELSIAPVNGQTQISLTAGPASANALPALGLFEGIISNPSTPATTSKTNSLHATYGLNLSSTLDLSSPADIKTAQSALSYAIAQVKQIYNDEVTVPSTAKTTGSTTGSVPPELQAELANYQAGLLRLTGSATAASTTDPLLGLFA
jgi:hypothetical protein